MALFDNIRLISTDDIKTNTLINYNVDDNVIGQSIKTCQEIYLRDIIGNKLLSKIKELVYNETVSGTEINEPYLMLVDKYIFEYLSQKVQSEICVAISFKIRNIGVSSDSDTNIQTLQIEGIEKLRDYYETFAVDAQNRLVEFLQENDIPEVDKCKLHKTANIGIYLGGQ